MDPTPDRLARAEAADAMNAPGPVRDEDASAPDDATADPAEIEDAGDELADADRPTREVQPETQGHDPVIADIGPGGEGDLSPGDA